MREIVDWIWWISKEELSDLSKLLWDKKKLEQMKKSWELSDLIDQILLETLTSLQDEKISNDQKAKIYEITKKLLVAVGRDETQIPPFKEQLNDANNLKIISDNIVIEKNDKQIFEISYMWNKLEWISFYNDWSAEYVKYLIANAILKIRKWTSKNTWIEFKTLPSKKQFHSLWYDIKNENIILNFIWTQNLVQDMISFDLKDINWFELNLSNYWEQIITSEKKDKKTIIINSIFAFIHKIIQK